ncbi:hypothetical protein [Bradyrhizobium sp. WSM1253]|uniref:hypothetical protein n=1 Tax=Bradyrhizobium sp. WSM1253 TaxID=319003 RepID=UPI00025D1851|nr:hypothetical protein [Bradyrhizobium sp. WSM1253]EIG56080.1 hypothetical protein Bra1253DRAFT_00688 [Bradyrhizobium sp. WSM1253]
MTEPQPIQTPPAPTPDEAVAKLADLRSNKDWTDNFLKGNGPQVAEFRSLSEIAIKSGDRIEKAIAGVLDDSPVQESGHIQNIGAAAWLREAGVETGVIRQVLTGDEVTPQEHAAATATKARLLKDQDFTKRYMASDGEAVRQMTLLNVIVSSKVKAEKQS